MCGATHKQFAIFFCYIAAMLLSTFAVIEVNYYLSVILMLPLSKSGALFPDIDHAWRNVKEKTTINWIINKIIHLTGGRHRSRHTHSWDIFVVSGILLYFVAQILYVVGKVSALDYSIVLIILSGFYSGWLSHLFSDSITSGGTYLFCWMKKPTVRFVPRKIGKFRFNTDGVWENFCYNVIRYINMATGLLVIIYPFITKPEFQSWFIGIMQGRI